MDAIIPEIQAGLSLRVFDAELWLDRVCPVRRLATATIRGLAGHALIHRNPELFDAAFKPDHNKPPAYLFQPVYLQEMEADAIPFRLITWDTSGELGEGVLNALSKASGRPFGESGAEVTTCLHRATHHLQFSGSGYEPELDIVFLTPLQLRMQKKLLTPETLSLGSILLAAARRLNLLSAHYGNGTQISPEYFQQLANGVRISHRRFSWKDPKRRSCTQSRVISLGGIVGSFRLHEPPPACLDLLATSEILHMGRHTAEGCGMIKILSVHQ